MEASITTERIGTRVAAYASVAGAEKAVRHVLERGTDPGEVAIVPTVLEPVPGAVSAVRRRVALTAGAVSGTVVAVAAIGFGVLDGSLDAALAAALLAMGCAIGMLVGAVTTRIDRRRSQRPELLRAERFEVRCTQRPAAVNHLLARWWDPSAPPAGP